MDPFRLCLALGPLAIYLLLLGLVNLSRRPLVTTGSRDVAALGIAVSGLLLVGPIELLVPQALRIPFNDFTWVFWLLIAALYLMVLALVVLSTRPRISIYNISADELRPVLAQVAQSLDPDARWAGSSLVLPSLRVELYLEHFAPLRHVSLVPIGMPQSFQGWWRLEQAVNAALRGREAPLNPAGLSLVFFGSLMFAAILTSWFRDPQAVAKAFVEMMGL
jgi:hypothetical protein